MNIVEINCETGIEIVREATQAELDDAKARVEKLANDEAQAAAKELAPECNDDGVAQVLEKLLIADA